MELQEAGNACNESDKCPPQYPKEPKGGPLSISPARRIGPQLPTCRSGVPAVPAVPQHGRPFWHRPQDSTTFCFTKGVVRLCSLAQAS
ncbi:hypothetical protein BD289DRAFT_430987 [Coniella lustricola]|uniref:Uncharacterized protein n=1 Tax=Coniella lustricola TaxID=2025994 RepID=A0A2T3AB77_9PEZI|nr:hypothetical protein BD289DRAFT_430987 [Coniella lustricola]